SVATDFSNNIYLAGSSSSGNNIATPNSYQSQSSLAGTVDAFLVKFDKNGNRIWGTYFGGTEREDAGVVELDNFGNVYLAGRTFSTSGIATPGAHQPNRNPSFYMDGF